MRLDRNEIIAGQRIKLVRDFLRAYRDGRPDLDSVAEFFGTESDLTTVLTAALVERGLITLAPPEKWDERPVVYTVTDLGIRFAAASLLKPILRAKADQIVTDLLVRVEQVNARDELTHFVGEVRAFGSYITDSPDVADVDLAISFVAKPPPERIGFCRMALGASAAVRSRVEFVHGRTDLQRTRSSPSGQRPQPVCFDPSDERSRHIES